MLTRDKSLSVLEAALKHSPAEQTEAVLVNTNLKLTRFAESVISQNISQEQSQLYITAVSDKKAGLVITGDLSSEGVRAAIEQAHQISLLQKPDRRFVSFPSNEQAPTLEKTNTADPNTEYNSQEMAAMVSEIAAKTDEKELKASGALRHEINTVAVANSLGVRQYGTHGEGSLSLTIVGEGEQSGYGFGYNPDPAGIDYQIIAERAIEKAAKNINPITLPDGQYTVILEPPAVGAFLLFLDFLGFNGRLMAQRRSFLSGKYGELITGENISITDEPDNPAFGGLLFDFEGMTKKRITPIDHGRAGDAAYDSYYGALMNTEATGHAQLPDSTYGPYPRNLAIAPGNKTIREMIESTEKGILITHFWYLNFLNPMQTLVTGTTFDGTFLIENGKIGSAIKNMRTNQSILEAFSNVEMIGKDREIYQQFGSLMLVPAMKINNFNLIQETKEEWEGKC